MEVGTSNLTILPFQQGIPAEDDLLDVPVRNTSSVFFKTLDITDLQAPLSLIPVQLKKDGKISFNFEINLPKLIPAPTAQNPNRMIPEKDPTT